MVKTCYYFHINCFFINSHNFQFESILLKRRFFRQYLIKCIQNDSGAFFWIIIKAGIVQAHLGIRLLSDYRSCFIDVLSGNVVHLTSSYHIARIKTTFCLIPSTHEPMVHLVVGTEPLFRRLFHDIGMPIPQLLKRGFQMRQGTVTV